MYAMVVPQVYLFMFFKSALLRFSLYIIMAIIDRAHPFRVQQQQHHPLLRTRTRTRTRKLYVPLLFCVG